MRPDSPRTKKARIKLQKDVTLRAVMQHGENSTVHVANIQQEIQQEEIDSIVHVANIQQEEIA